MSEFSPNLAEKNNSSKKIVWLFLAISLAVHTPVLWVKLRMSELAHSLKDQVNHEKIIKLVLQNKKVTESQQIVNNEKVGEEIEPAKARFLSERNQKVEKEMTQKEVGTFKVAGAGIENGSDSAIAAQKHQATPSAAKKKVSAKSKTQVKKQSEKITFADLALDNPPSPEVVQKRSAQINKAPKGIKKGQRGKSGLGSNNDYIEDVPLGDMTALNAVEYKYFGFYHRIRQQLEQHWGKSLREQVENLYRTGRKIASGQDKITSLRITIDHKGQIMDVHVQGSSGVSELDRAAIEAFNRAGPFPNPPTGMLQGGMAEIEWGFVVKS